MRRSRNARQEPRLSSRQLSLNLAHAPWKLAAKQAGFTCYEIWGGCHKAVGMRVIAGNDVNRSSSLISVRDHCEANGGCSAG